MKKFGVMILSLFLVFSLLSSGCKSEFDLNMEIDKAGTPKLDIPTSENETVSDRYGLKKSSVNMKIDSEETTEKELTEQRNSFSMMYYLAIIAEEIRTNKDNRIALEEIYTSLLNDINPGAVDEITQNHLRNLRDIIKSYLSISEKRERVQFIYNQEKAAAIKRALPDPVSVLSIANSFSSSGEVNWAKLATSVLFTAVDSYMSYKQAQNSAELEFIMSNWELDDDEKEAVMKNRDRAFDYMVDMVQEYNLDGLKTLNEKTIEKFVEICAIENPSERIKRFIAEEKSYSLLGLYWLELSDAYYETKQYQKCLDCVARYNELSAGIYRKDYNYIQIIPKAIVAAQKVYTGEKYVSAISAFADTIYNNEHDDWAVRYFAAEVYIDLFTKTDDISYIKKAYTLASENVVFLLEGQRKLNKTYLNDVVEQTISEPDYRYMNDIQKKEAEKEYKEEKNRLKKYNKTLKEKRKTELPSLYQPLILNCELMFSLANTFGISEQEKVDVEAYLETATNGIFIVKPINDAYSFTEVNNKYSIELTKESVIIPADLLTSDSKVTVAVNRNEENVEFNDWFVKKVERKGATPDSFDTYLTSEQFEKFEWELGSKVSVTITYTDAYDKKIDFTFTVSEFESHWYGDKVVFTAQ